MDERVNDAGLEVGLEAFFLSAGGEGDLVSAGGGGD